MIFGLGMVGVVYVLILFLALIFTMTIMESLGMLSAFSLRLFFFSVNDCVCVCLGTERETYAVDGLRNCYYYVRYLLSIIPWFRGFLHLVVCSLEFPSSGIGYLLAFARV